MTLARKKFTEFKERGDQISDAELDDFWASLEPATIDGMIGEWKGGEFATGHRINGSLERSAGSARPSNPPPTCSRWSAWTPTATSSPTWSG